jgi:hypothetical protein
MGDVGTNGMGTITRIFAAGFIDVGRRGRRSPKCIQEGNRNRPCRVGEKRLAQRR